MRDESEPRLDDDESDVEPDADRKGAAEIGGAMMVMAAVVTMPVPVPVVVIVVPGQGLAPASTRRAAYHRIRV
jgi:hypothetical protein